MKRLLVVGVLTGVAAAAGAASIATYRMTSDETYAEVLRVTPLVAAIETPHGGDAQADITEHTWGYSVLYRIGHETGIVRIDHDPGDRIPVHEGRLAVSDVRAIEIEPDPGAQ
jgi:uncharacterized protein YcfJ